MENINKILNIMAEILNGSSPEYLLTLLPYDKDELADYYETVAQNDAMSFFLFNLEGWFYEHEDEIKRENPRVFEYWQDNWSYPLFDKVEPAFFTDEPELWQSFLEEMQTFVKHTRQLISL